MTHSKARYLTREKGIERFIVKKRKKKKKKKLRGRDNRIVK